LEEIRSRVREMGSKQDAARTREQRITTKRKPKNLDGVVLVNGYSLKIKYKPMKEGIHI
jgi:hypothetical protein